MKKQLFPCVFSHLSILLLHYESLYCNLMSHIERSRMIVKEFDKYGYHARVIGYHQEYISLQKLHSSTMSAVDHITITTNTSIFTSTQLATDTVHVHSHYTCLPCTVLTKGGSTCIFTKWSKQVACTDVELTTAATQQWRRRDSQLSFHASSSSLTATSLCPPHH